MTASENTPELVALAGLLVALLKQTASLYGLTLPELAQELAHPTPGSGIDVEGIFRELAALMAGVDVHAVIGLLQ